MGRRYQEIQEKASRDVDGAKTILKRLGDRERAFILAWLAKYYADDGELRSGQVDKQRKTMVLDGVEYWLVRIPKCSR